MITELLLGTFFRITRLFLEFLPVMSIPFETIGSISGLLELIVSASYFLPIGIIQLSLIVWLSVNNLQAIKQAIDYVLRKIPTIG